MEISEILGANNTNNTGSPLSAATAGQSLGRDDFLQLLVTQLSNQNPLEPMKPDDFSVQLAQFSSLEQLTNLNDLMEASAQTNLLLTTSINNTLAANVIGKQVKAFGSETYFDGNNVAKLTYDLPSDAASVNVEILDKSGKVVRTVELGSASAGEQGYTWDGKDDNGNTLDAANYDFRVTANDLGGNEMNVLTYMTGLITGLRYGSNGPTLVMGNTEVRMANVLEIGLPESGSGNNGGNSGGGIVPQNDNTSL